MDRLKLIVSIILFHNIPIYAFKQTCLYSTPNSIDQEKLMMTLPNYLRELNVDVELYEIL